jgi:hypothetical protein
MRRRHFLGGAAAALGLAGCGQQTATSTAIPSTRLTSSVGVTALRGGTHVPDLRFGQAPLPAGSPGYDPAGDASALILPGTPSPATSPIPGTQLTGSYATDERFVIRVPDAWNGKLVVVGTPAFRSEFANDAIWGDFLLAHGYAYACSNKGIPYNAVVETIANSQSPSTAYPIAFNLAGLEAGKYTFRLGALAPNKKSIEGWNDDFFRLTINAQAYLDKRFKHPTRTYAVGLSNGGAQVRSLLEQHPGLVDGGVDWSGVYWSPQQSILDYLPKFLTAMQAYIASGFTDAGAAAAIIAAGYPADLRGAAGHPSLWFDYYAGQPSFYADLTTFAYALLLDPQATSSIAAAGCTPNAVNPVQLPGTCDASGLAQPSARNAYVPSAGARAEIATFAHTGRIRQPLISIAGTDDMFITNANNATPYLNAVKAAGGSAQYWQFLVQGGTHVDTFANPTWGYGLQPQLPFAWAAFNQLVAVVEHGATLAGAGTQRVVSSPSQIS